MAAAPQGTDIIFCGNPGVGKSTLLSSISNQQFQSGLSWGEGLTCELAFKQCPQLPNMRFGDTPGLADIAMAEKASKAITQALTDAASSGRVVKLFFVVTVEAGRVKPDDLFTIKQVMGSITLPDGSKPPENSYALIINKCTFLERPDFEAKGQPALQKAVGLQTETVPFTTTYVKFLPNVAAAVDAENEKVSFDDMLLWVLKFPGLKAIAKANVIDVSSLEEKLKEAREQHKKEMDALAQKLESGHKEEIKKMEQRMAASQADMMKRLERAEQEAAARGGGIMGAMVDVGTLMSKPICKAIDKGKGASEEDFQRSWLEHIGSLKKYCII